MLELIKDTINLKIDLETFTNSIINKGFKNIDEVKISNFLISLDNEDQSLIIFLILYFIGNIRFKNIQNETIDFFNYILEEINSDLSGNIVWHLKDQNNLIFSIDETYFLINYNIENNKLTLPNVLQNSTLFCLNCNHEMYFNKTINLEPYEFYILTK